MTTELTNTAWKRSGSSNTRHMAELERAHYTVRWFQDGRRPESTGEGRPSSGSGSCR